MVNASSDKYFGGMNYQLVRIKSSRKQLQTFFLEMKLKLVEVSNLHHMLEHENFWLGLAHQLFASAFDIDKSRYFAQPRLIIDNYKHAPRDKAHRPKLLKYSRGHFSKQSQYSLTSVLRPHCVTILLAREHLVRL